MNDHGHWKCQVRGQNSGGEAGGGKEGTCILGWNLFFCPSWPDPFSQAFGHGDHHRQPPQSSNGPLTLCVNLGKKGKRHQPSQPRPTKDQLEALFSIWRGRRERKKRSKGSKDWERNPFACQVAPMLCLHPNCRRAQTSSQPIEIKHSFFNVHYGKWKHTQKHRKQYNECLFTSHLVATETKAS